MDTSRVRRSLSDCSHKPRSRSVNRRRHTSLTETTPTTDSDSEHPTRGQLRWSMTNRPSSPSEGSRTGACIDVPTRPYSHTTLYTRSSNTSVGGEVEVTRCRPGSPPPDLLVLDRGEKIQVKVKRELASVCMKMVKKQESFCVKAAPYKSKAASSFFFTSQVVKAVDKDTLTQQFVLYLFSMTIENETHYLHPVYSSDHCDAETLQLRLVRASRENIITDDGIPESGQEFFFCLKNQSHPVLESLAYQGYYLSFEGNKSKQVVVRKASEHMNLPSNYNIEIYPVGHKQYPSSMIFRRIIPCLKRMDSEIAQ